MIEHGRYTSGRVAVANLTATIDGLERRLGGELDGPALLALANLLFVRGDLLGRIVDHDRAEAVALEAARSATEPATSAYIRARLAGRFHRFEDAGTLLEAALAGGHPRREIDAERAALLQATGRYSEALSLRQRLAQEEPGLHALGALGSLEADMGQWTAAEASYAAALAADAGVSPLPVGQVLFEWAIGAMRRSELRRAEALFCELDTILPQHVPARGHRAEVALARGQLELARTLVEPLIDVSDDPEYRGTYAEILAAAGERDAARCEAARAGAAYEVLLARRPEAYADHAAAFFTGIGNRPQRAVELALLNRRLRNTPRSRRLLARARRAAAASRTQSTAGLPPSTVPAAAHQRVS